MIRFLVANFQALFKEFEEIPTELYEIIIEHVQQEKSQYSEVFPEIALHNHVEQYQIDFMKPFFEERFISKYLNNIFSATYSSESIPRFIFLEDIVESQLEYQGQNIKFANLDSFYKECSALANSLGLVLNERDNYPGGKQKLAFNLIDIAWSAKQSKYPIIIF
jgi:hypothetical protein